MNKKKKEVYNSYHTPGCSSIYKRKINAIFINPANSLKHEIAKLKVCYEFRTLGIDFITECVENKKDKEGKQRRRDIVNLATGDIVEIEVDMVRASRFLKEPEVIIIPVGWKKTDKKWLKLVEKNAQ